jgi:glutathione S-transferase
MKLYNNRPSPYGRKVLVAAHEKQLLERIDVIQLDPWSDPLELLATTPLGKVPAFITDDDILITESTLIAEYFDVIGSGTLCLLGADRLSTLRRTALAQGLIDAAFALVIERRRPANRQWEEWSARQGRVIERTLATVPTPDSFDLAGITLACGLAYIDFRLPEFAWRSLRPDLAFWLEEAAQRPSMQATKP